MSRFRYTADVRYELHLPKTAKTIYKMLAQRAFEYYSLPSQKTIILLLRDNECFDCEWGR